MLAHLPSLIRSALITPPGCTVDCEWDDESYSSSFVALNKTLRTMRLLQAHIYSKQRMAATRLILQRQWKGGAATTAMGVQAPLWFDAALAALVARQAERDADAESDNDFYDMAEDEIEVEMEDGEPLDPMRPPTPDFVMTS